MRRITELDAVRGLAAVVIVVYHLWFPHSGFLGTAVNLFFVMSGYLITTIILKQGDQPGFLGSFFIRRSLRIWPIYYLSLVVFLAINSTLSTPYPTSGLLWFLTYTQNVPHFWGSLSPPFAHGFHHTWSLAIEEQFYLFWPVALVVLGRRALIPLATGLIVLSVGTRMAGFSRWISMTNCDGLALGAVLAWMMAAVGPGRELSLDAIKKILFVTGAGSFAAVVAGQLLSRFSVPNGSVFVNPHVVGSLRMFATNLMFFSLTGLLAVFSGHRRLAWLRDARLVELGQMSYGIYLYHYILFDLIQDYATAHGFTDRFVLDALKLSASFGLAAASWRWLERPLLSLKGHFSYRRPAREATPGRVETPRLDTLPSGNV